ncbi:MAG: PiT family inorganic phosphate transporter [Candidatus Krumholzibacteriia bacterium]
MDVILYLSAGLFLGWSLGANDAANVFGTAVGTRMIKFRTAALVCSFFVVLGATISGAGAADTLGKLGAVNALPGSFAVAMASALTTYLMTRLKIPVSTSQAIVGAIIGWNLYTSNLTDSSSLTKIVITWVACPVLSGTMAILLFVFVKWSIKMAKPHLLQLDHGTRLGLLIVGAFGSYSLGANNIANVMGVFLPDNPFNDFIMFDFLRITAVQQLFFIGALAIGVGVFTYSERVMNTVGSGLVRISPVPAFVIVLAQSLTLFVFASRGLESFLSSQGLPTFPLVPVSSSQAVVGAIVGLSLFKRIGIRYRVLSEISMGWLATPLMACAISFVALFVMDNVLDQKIQRVVAYRWEPVVAVELESRGIADAGLDAMPNFKNARQLQSYLKSKTQLESDEIFTVIELAATGLWQVPEVILESDGVHWGLNSEQVAGLQKLQGQSFDRSWLLREALQKTTSAWREPAAEVESKIILVTRVIRQ